MKDKRLELKAEYLVNNINYLMNKIENNCYYHPISGRRDMYNKLKRIKFLVKEVLKQIDDFEDKHGAKAMPERIKTYE